MTLARKNLLFDSAFLITVAIVGTAAMAVYGTAIATQDKLRIWSQAPVISTADDNGVAVVSLDCDGKIFAWNVGAEKLFGYPAKDALGKSIEIITDEEMSESHEKVYRDSMAKAKRSVKEVDCTAYRKSTTGTAEPIDIKMIIASSPPHGATAIILDNSSVVKTDVRYGKTERH